MDQPTLAERNDFSSRFSPINYLNEGYMITGEFVDIIHKVFARLFPQCFGETGNIWVLDYGCGPVVCHAISAAGIPRVSEIVMAEFTARNREVIQQWIDKTLTGFDWSHYLRHVVQTLEGKTELEVAKREERMRSLIKVVPCDITQDPPIEKGYEGSYDILISSLCLETSCNSIEEYHKGVHVAKLSNMLKTGGLLLIFSINMQPEGEEPRYHVGSNAFYSLKISYNIVVSALEEASCNILTVEHVKVIADPAIDNCENFVGVCGKKK